MKAKLVDSMPSGDWIYEIESDGYRALVLRGGNEARLLSPVGKIASTIAVNLLHSIGFEPGSQQSPLMRGTDRVGRKTTPPGDSLHVALDVVRGVRLEIVERCSDAIATKGYTLPVVPILARTSPGLAKHTTSSASPCVSQFYMYAPGQRWKKV